MKKKILIAFGTRPEALKFVPLIETLRRSGQFQVFVCLTGQHREMLDQVVKLFKIKINADLRLMKPNQSLHYLTAEVVGKFGEVLEKIKPNLIFVQGDTTTALMVALTSFYSKYRIAHLEAGLRTRNKWQPFPEEINRVLISRLADYHFTPTKFATQNLIKEGIPKKLIFQVGNSIVDTVNVTKPLLKKNYPIFKTINQKKRILFVTAHRRESFGQDLKQIFTALKSITSRNSDVEIVYPVHLNPHVMIAAHKILNNIKRIHLLRPLSYEETCWIMKNSYLILTDSGGIQEEAPSFKKPVLVLRNTTERPEGIKAGIAKLVGTNQKKIIYQTEQLLSSSKLYKRMSAKKNPYGDGSTSRRIASQLKKILNRKGA